MLSVTAELAGRELVVTLDDADDSAFLAAEAGSYSVWSPLLPIGTFDSAAIDSIRVAGTSDANQFFSIRPGGSINARLTVDAEVEITEVSADIVSEAVRIDSPLITLAGNVTTDAPSAVAATTSQHYTGNVRVGGDIVLTAGGGAPPPGSTTARRDITFGSTVDSLPGVVATLDTGFGTPSHVAVSPDGSRLYATDSVASVVYVIDTATQTLQNTIDFTNPQSDTSISVSQIVVSPDGSRLYVSNNLDRTVTPIDVASLTRLPALAVGDTPEGMAFSADGTRLYVANYSDDTVSVINVSQGRVVETIAVGGGPSAITLSADETVIYVANETGNSVTAIDRATSVVMDTIPVGADPTAMVISDDSSRLYVVNNVGNSVSVVDTASGTEVATVPVGAGPSGAAISSDGRRLFVVNSFAENTWVIDTESLEVIGTMAVGSLPMGIAFSPATNRGYVANVDGFSVIEDRGMNLSVQASGTVTFAGRVGSNDSLGSLAVDARDEKWLGTANSLLSFTSGGKWMLSQNTGSGMASSEFASWTTAIDWVDTLTGDFNGDGLVDVLGRNAANGAWYASLNQGDGTGSTRFMATWSAGANWQNLQVGDFNGDGIDDIAGRASSGAWYAGLGRADGSGLTTKYMTAWSRLVSWGDIRVGDFNGDGTDDIAGRLESNGQWWAAITAADGSAVNHDMGTWSTALSWNDVAVGDFNGDGIDDIVGRTSNSGAWYAALGSSGTPGFANRFLGAWNPTITWHEVTVADVDGDGRSDIIGRLGLPGNPANGQWWVGRMQSDRPADQPGFTNQLWGRWSQIDWQQTSFGDFDGDGRLDVIGHLPLDHPSQPGQWWIGRNTGSSFTNAAFGDYGRNAAGESIGALGTVLKSFTIPGP